MKTTSISSIIILALSLLLYSCNDDSNFSGEDNFIYSFSLEKDGISYSGQITDDSIKINIPENINLTNATVKYKLSELATISPDPASIKNWSSNMYFEVTSYNKTSRNYTLSINRSKVEYSGNVTLMTQSDVDSFATCGVTIINGNLTLGSKRAVGEKDSIRNLNGLSGLTEVSNNIILNNSIKCNNLEGLSSIKKVGNIYIGSVSTPLNVADTMDVTFSSLEKAGAVIVNCNTIKSVSFPKLNGVFRLFINSSSMNKIDLSSLEEVSGEIAIQSGTDANSTTSNSKIRNIEIEKLERVTESFSIQGLVSVEKVNLPHLNIVGYNLNINYLSSLTEINIPNLKAVNNKFTMTYLNALSEFKAEKLSSLGAFSLLGNSTAKPIKNFNLSSLETINGDFELSYSSLESLFFPLLKKIEGQFKIDHAEKLTSIGLANLRQCNKIYLSYLSLLTNLDLSGITELGNLELLSDYVIANIKMPENISGITINGGSKATTFPVFEGLKNVTGNFSISNFKLNNIAIPNIKSIGSYTQTSGTNHLVLSFSDLEKIGTLKMSVSYLNTLNAPKLVRIGTLDFSSMNNLINIDFSSLNEITDNMKIWGSTYESGATNCKLTNLNSFSHITKIGSIDIKWCGNLCDYKGLSNAMHSLSSEKFSVSGCKYNPTFQDISNGKFSE